MNGLRSLFLRWTLEGFEIERMSVKLIFKNYMYWDKFKFGMKRLGICLTSIENPNGLTTNDIYHRTLKRFEFIVG